MNDFSESNQSKLDNFLCPHSRYYGEFSPQNLAFNANLQEFSQRVNYICALGTNGKLTSSEAYLEIKQLWKKLKKSKKALSIDISDMPPEHL